MKESKLKAIFSIVAVMLVIMAFSIPAFAAESYYASDESGNTSIPSSIDSITISKADVDIPHTGDNSNELTPNGNMSLIDDFLQMGGYITSGKEDEEIKQYAAAYASAAMKPKQAAGIFESMTDNLELAAKILNAMSADDRGAIMGVMDPGVAAKLTKIMDPES